MICVTVIPVGTNIGGESGAPQAFLTQPVIGVDPTCSSGSYQLVDQSSSFFALSPSDGSQIALAIVMVWTVGLCFRLLLKVLNLSDKPTAEE